VAAARGSLSAHPGPVHVNVAFREPLTPGGDAVPPGFPDPVDALGHDAGLTRAEQARIVPPVIEPGPRTVVLAGDSAGPQAWLLAARAGWPLLAEPSSGARYGPAAVGPYRLLLDHPGLGDRIERLVVLGHPTLSRPVQRLLARDGLEVIVVSRRPDWPDAASRAARVLPGVALPPRPFDLPLEPDDWLQRWRLAGEAAAGAVDGVLDAEAAAGRLTGPLLAREAAAALGPGQVLVAGSSNPIRDLDLAAHPFPEFEPPEIETPEIGTPEVEPGAPDGRAVLANRGLAGIDGTLSTASGVALARAAAADGTARAPRLPVRALVGDLTFLHDLGGLLVGPRERRPHLQVLVVDDDGGGIFGLLEPGEEARRDGEAATTFERVFGTPHGADLGALCAGFGVGYTVIKDLPALRAALATPPSGTSVLRARIDRAGQRALADRVAAAVATAVTAALSG